MRVPACSVPRTLPATFDARLRASHSRPAPPECAARRRRRASASRCSSHRSSRACRAPVRLAADGAEGAHIGVAHAMDEAHGIADRGRRRSGARTCCPSRVRRAAREPMTKSALPAVIGEVSRAINSGLSRAVAIHEDDDVAGVACRQRALQAGAAIAAPGIDHPRARRRVRARPCGRGCRHRRR